MDLMYAALSMGPMPAILTLITNNAKCSVIVFGNRLIIITNQLGTV